MPPPPPARPVRSAAWIVLGVVCLTFAGFAVVVGSFVLYVIASGEAHDVFALDDGRIREVATNGCTELTDVILRSEGSRIQNIHDGNRVIATLVADLNALGRRRLADDEPALDWIADWEQLAAARATFAESLAAGRTEAFVVPVTTDGSPITDRMKSVAPYECERAISFAAQP